MSKDKHWKAEAFLREREKLCVSASSRFLQLRESRGHVWYLADQKEEISALMLHSHRTLFPVFDRNPNIPGPRFLNRFLGKVPIHALQGLREDAQLLEGLLEAQGYHATERIEYELMNLDNATFPPALRTGPANLVLRPPLPEDLEYLVALQTAYEREEVLPGNSVFNPALPRLNLERILSKEHVLVAELNGEAVGKINTSAESFTRYQIGGVYVRPEYRGLGIGTRMTAVFAGTLLAGGKGVTLFVKKRNIAARAAYRKAGFSAIADYRITYY